MLKRREKLSAFNGQKINELTDNSIIMAARGQQHYQINQNAQ
ncbi:MAG TPA: hypothetical protein VJL89_12945 [Thermodesulfovibrionia bacterium]|nr:hypothetical protein [Thermodesulfovibrionia bacterium]